MKIGLLSTQHDPFLGILLDKINDSNLRIAAVILDSKDFSDKNKKIFAERTDRRIKSLSVHEITYKPPFYFIDNHNSDACVDLIKDLDLDILVNAGSPRILKDNILSSTKKGILNCHPGLLPEFRGCCCVEWAIYYDKQIGNTVHFMDSGIDTGPIVMKEGLFFSKNDRYVDVRVKVYLHRLDMIVKGINKINEENLGIENFPKQDEGSYHSLMDNDKLQECIKRLDERKYSFQVEGT